MTPEEQEHLPARGGFARNLTASAGGVCATALLFFVLPVLNRATTRLPETRPARDIDLFRLPSPPEPELPTPAMQEPTTPAPVPPAPRPESRPAEIIPPTVPVLTALPPLGVDLRADFTVAPSAPHVRTVFALSDADSPPEPLARIEPAYPAHARARRLQGHIVIEFVVDSDGTTRDISVVSADPAGIFESAAVRAAGSWRFRPARVGGREVPVRVRQRVTFRLEDSW